MATPTHKQAIVHALLDKFPDAPTKTLARKAYDANPEVWATLDSCRGCIRYHRGAVGKKNRAKLTDTSRVREPQQPGDPFGAIPEGWEEMPDWKAFTIDGPCKALFLADVHVPYHDAPALRLALNAGKDRGADVVVLNGDFLDCFALSKWEKDPRQRNFRGELETCRETLKVIRDGLPDARLVFKIGNHEERFESYMMAKAPELLDVDDFQFASLLRFEDMGIEEVRDKRPVKLGKLSVIHGHEYSFAISNPVNPARGLFLRARVNAVMSHLHQSSNHSESDMDGDITTCWSTGCLCGLHPLYRPLNKWNHGFFFAAIEADGAFETWNPRIIDGRVYG